MWVRPDVHTQDSKLKELVRGLGTPDVAFGKGDVYM